MSKNFLQTYEYGVNYGNYEKLKDAYDMLGGKTGIKDAAKSSRRRKNFLKQLKKKIGQLTRHMLKHGNN